MQISLQTGSALTLFCFAISLMNFPYKLPRTSNFNDLFPLTIRKYPADIPERVKYGDLDILH